MKIKISVADGVHGQPVEGMKVTLLNLSHDARAGRIQGRTNGAGEFEYSGFHTDPVIGEVCHVELDAEAYFTTLGMTCLYKKIIIQIRIPNPENECRITSLITPFAQTTYCVQR
jgi:5-hydroxyisourate hydrolase-like protein (transthyretin family)